MLLHRSVVYCAMGGPLVCCVESASCSVFTVCSQTDLEEAPSVLLLLSTVVLMTGGC